MKYIVKGAEPRALSDWKKLANEDWQPSYETLSGKPKRAVKAELMLEQGYLCCYCERHLVDGDSHIEHFKPQSDKAVDPLDYSNMLCSCQNHISKGAPRHCGNLKGDWFDNVLLVSPLSKECEELFGYTADGSIYAADDNAAAKETIERLGLDLPKLISLRAAAIEPFLDEELTNDELNRFVQGYLQKTADGRLGQFWTMIYSLFGAAITLGV